jgi:hypothetical protein
MGFEVVQDQDYLLVVGVLLLSTFKNSINVSSLESDP